MIYGRLLRLPAPEVDRNEVAEKAVEAFNRVIALEKAGSEYKNTPARHGKRYAEVYNEEGDQNANLELNEWTRFPTTGKPLKPRTMPAKGKKIIKRRFDDGLNYMIYI